MVNAITTMINKKYTSTMKQVLKAVSPIHFKFNSVYYAAESSVSMEGVVAKEDVDC
jgi:hypothetical protein